MKDLFDQLRESESGVLGGMVGIFLIAGLVALVAMIFFLLTLHKAMENVAPDNRKMVPGLVWLWLIPYFNVIWIFIMAGKIADSLAAEFKRRNITVFEERPGFGTGTALGCVGIFSTLLGYAGTPVLSLILNVVWLACWITYWVKIAGFRSKLAESGHWSQYMPSYTPPADPNQFHYQPPVYGPQNPFAPPPQTPPPPQPQWNYPPPAQPYYPPPPQYPPVPPPNYPPPAPPQDPNDLSRWAPPPPTDKP